MSDKIKVLKIVREDYDGVREDDSYDDDKFWFEEDTNITATVDFDRTIDINEIDKISKNNKISLIQNPNSNFFRPTEKTFTFNKFDLQKPKYETFSILDKSSQHKQSRIREEIINLRRATYEQEQIDKENLLNKLNVDLKLQDNFKNYKLADEQTKNDQKLYDKLATQNLYSSNEFEKEQKSLFKKDKTVTMDKVSDNEKTDKKENTENTTIINMDEIKNNFSKMRTKLRSDFQKSRFKTFLHDKDFTKDKTAFEEFKKQNNTQVFSENMTKEDQDFFSDLQKSFGKFYDKLSEDSSETNNDKKVNNESEPVVKENFEENVEIKPQKQNESVNQTINVTKLEDIDSEIPGLNKKKKGRTPITNDYEYTVSDTLDDFNKVLNNYSSKQELKDQIKSMFENKSSDTTQLLSSIVQKAKKIKNDETQKEIIQFSDFESLLDDQKYVKSIAKIAKKEKKRLKKETKK
ncbi:hypothetical protein SLITO_v1c07680 [Spiroplasma litorale]|uniref:Uncharacterized protein n=1 Tax=Spiroplasma litorale TaxID=216942 RepID=A0A0K1W2I8_9MOLU|nr:hypothetical protein [Spiroplasma litorale]AKX34391.1 hypothetical protein SLITO_v1c07680 [Spiroplasma litorale]